MLLPKFIQELSMVKELKTEKKKQKKKIADEETDEKHEIKEEEIKLATVESEKETKTDQNVEENKKEQEAEVTKEEEAITEEEAEISPKFQPEEVNPLTPKEQNKILAEFQDKDVVKRILDGYLPRLMKVNNVRYLYLRKPKEKNMISLGKFHAFKRDMILKLFPKIEGEDSFIATIYRKKKQQYKLVQPPQEFQMGYNIPLNSKEEQQQEQDGGDEGSPKGKILSTNISKLPPLEDKLSISLSTLNYYAYLQNKGYMGTLSEFINETVEEYFTIKGIKYGFQVET